MYLFILKLFVNKNLVIVRIDGGICSQMIQFAFGQLLIEKMTKSKTTVLKYDLSWFKDCGWDLLHKDKRNFDLEKLFPYLTIQKATEKEIKVYKEFFNTQITDFNELCKMQAPLCLNSYYDFPSDCYVETLRKIYTFNNISLDNENKRMLEVIKSFSNSCGVHVRRGDLANQEIAIKSGYKSGICDTDYFLNAIKIMYEKYHVIKFFFFSDDINYVKQILLPEINKLNNIKIEIIDINTPENGYKDLLLLSNCNHQIASVGSLGLTAYILNNNKEKVLITNKEFYYNLAEQGVLLDNSGKEIKYK